MSQAINERNLKLFHHAFAMIGTITICVVASLMLVTGYLEMSAATTTMGLIIFCVVSFAFSIVFFLPIQDRLNKEQIVFLHMLWGQFALVILAYFSSSVIEISMMLSLADFVFVIFGTPPLRLSLCVTVMVCVFGGILYLKDAYHAPEVKSLMLGTYTVSAIFIASINSFMAKMQASLAHQNDIIKKRTYDLEVAQSELLEAMNQAEELVHSKTRFLAAASHDLRQPLHALELYMGALKNEESADETQHLLQQMNRSADELGLLLNSLFDISRFDTNVVDLNIEKISLNEMVEDISEEISDLAQQYGKAVTLRRSKKGVVSDRMLLIRIIRGLVCNALIHADKGRILVGFRTRGDKVRLEVRDNGVGIANSDQAKIFEEFYQVKNYNRDRSKGLGLGLALIKRMCLALGHEFGVESTLGRGTLFWVEMPVAQIDFGQAKRQSNTTNNLVSLHGKTVVVLDDEQAVLEGTIKLLSSWGCLVCAATDHEIAVRKLTVSNAKPDLIISDYRLAEGQNGFDAIERITTEFNIDIPAIVVTGDLDPSISDKADSLALVVIRKPLAADRLAVVMQSVLADVSSAENSQLSRSKRGLS